MQVIWNYVQDGTALKISTSNRAIKPIAKPIKSGQLIKPNFRPSTIRKLQRIFKNLGFDMRGIAPSITKNHS